MFGHHFLYRIDRACFLLGSESRTKSRRKLTFRLLEVVENLCYSFLKFNAFTT